MLIAWFFGKCRPGAGGRDGIKTINKPSDGFWFRTDQGEGLGGRARPHLLSLLGSCRRASHSGLRTPSTLVLVLTGPAGDSGSPLGRAHPQHQELGPGPNQPGFEPAKGGQITEQVKEQGLMLRAKEGERSPVRNSEGKCACRAPSILHKPPLVKSTDVLKSVFSEDTISCIVLLPGGQGVKTGGYLAPGQTKCPFCLR